MIAKKNEFAYKEIYDKLKSELISGRYKAGEKIPSADELAKYFSVNRLTVRRALSYLIAEGFIYTKPAQGTYVAEDLESLIKITKKGAPNSSSSILNVAIVSRVIISDNIGYYHSNILAGIHRGLIENKANMVLLPFHHGENENILFSHVTKNKFDAAIYIGPFDPLKLKTIIQNGPPSVIVDFKIKNSGTDCIVIDNFNGAKCAIAHLISLGHKSIAVVAGQKEQQASKERLEGVYSALEEHRSENINLKIYEGDFSLKSGYHYTVKILSEQKIPTAIFYMNDEMAHGGINAIREFSELKIPEDISVIGFDNSIHATLTFPQLTTIAVPTFQMGRLAVQQLFERFRNREDYYPGIIQLETKFIKRNSTSFFKK